MFLNIFKFSFFKKAINKKESKKIQINEEDKTRRREENLKRYFFIKTIKEKWKNKDYTVVNETFHHYSFNIDNTEHVYGIVGVLDIVDINLNSEEEFYFLLCLDYSDVKEFRNIGLGLSESLELELINNNVFHNIDQLWLHIYKEYLKDNSLYVAFYNAIKLFSPEQFNKLNNTEIFRHYHNVNKSMNNF